MEKSSFFLLLCYVVVSRLMKLFSCPRHVFMSCDPDSTKNHCLIKKIRDMHIIAKMYIVQNLNKN